MLLELPNCRVKLADFGVATQLATVSGKKAQTFVGTPFFMAPEVIDGGRYDERVCGEVGNVVRPTCTRPHSYVRPVVVSTCQCGFVFHGAHNLWREGLYQ